MMMGEVQSLPSWRRTTAMMQVYLGLRCWPREKNYDDG